MPFVKLDPVSGTTNPFNSQQVASTIQFGKDVSKALNLNSNQHLTIFGSFGYNDFSADAAAVGLRTNGGTIVGSLGAKWQVNSDYVRAWTGLNDGRASTQTTTAGNWNSDLFGSGGDFAAGHISYLWKPTELLLRSDGWRSPFIMLDTSAHVGYSQLHGSGFTDGNGAVWGDFDGRTSRSQASPRNCRRPIMAKTTTCRLLFAPASTLISPPGKTSAFRRKPVLVLPILSYSVCPATSARSEAGLKYWSFSDITVTLAANYNVSEIGSGYGGSLAVKIPLEALLTPQQQASIAPIVTKAH